MQTQDIKIAAAWDYLISFGLWGVTGGSLVLTLMFGKSIPKEVKYAGLLTGLGASLATVAYEAMDSTKITRAQLKQQRKHGLTISAAQFANALADDLLAIRGEAEADTIKTLNAMPAEARKTLTVGMGTPMDANPSTQTIDAPAKPVNPTVHSPAYVARKAGASNEVQVYLQYIHRHIISKLGQRPSSFLFHGVTRDGKSTLCQFFVYALALNAIAKGNRLVCTVLIPHGIDHRKAQTDLFHPLWNGLPEKPATNEGVLESAALKVTPKTLLPYLKELDTELEIRVTDDDYSWSDAQSQTPAMCLVVDDATNLLRRMSDAERTEAAVIIGRIAQDGSKYGVFVWLLMQDTTKERTGIDPGAWASMQTIYGYRALDRFGPKTHESKAALSQMKQQLGKTEHAAGYWNEDLGYLPPPALKSVRELCLTWQTPPVDKFDAQISMVNMLRERIVEPEKMSDEALITNAIEFSTFTCDEVKEYMPYVRVLLSFSKEEYESRVTEMRNKILNDEL